MREERRHEVVALGFELQDTCVGHIIGGLWNSTACVLHPLRVICMGDHKDLALKPREIGHKNGTKLLRLPAMTGQLKELAFMNAFRTLRHSEVR